jgi:hypothetical protein
VFVPAIVAIGAMLPLAPGAHTVTVSAGWFAT